LNNIRRLEGHPNINQNKQNAFNNYNKINSNLKRNGNNIMNNNTNNNNRHINQQNFNIQEFFGDFSNFFNDQNQGRRMNSNHQSNIRNNGERIIFTINNRGNNQNINFANEDVFDPIFSFFGTSFSDLFRNNFDMNFRSNSSHINLMDIINESMRTAETSKKPVSKQALSKLKKFKMSEKYFKKNKNGQTEQPTCCVCLSDIVLNEETLLLPCGHMFHPKCINDWFKNNNTCPVCRFELKTE